MGRLVDRYREVTLPDRIDLLERLAADLAGHRLLHINATRRGGGVAEMLERMMPLFTDLGISARWEVLTGSPEFFAVTKAFHNGLQGQDVVLTPAMRNTYLDCVRQNLPRLDLSADSVFIDDPQPAALVEGRDRRVPWIWRCHIDLSRPDREIWQFLSPFIVQYDAAVFSLPKFSRRLPIPQFLIWPTIDPLAEKNRDLTDGEIDSVLERLGVGRDRPILLQVSRFDRFKDPLGVVKAFRLVRRYIPCTLVLAGGTADDDPEGAAVLSEVREAADGDPDIRILVLPPDAHQEINALQRAATVVLQKSTREGFGLTVTEALWKAKPVVGGLAGGIGTQIIHGVTGFLVSSIEGAAFRVRTLIENPELARRMGEEGREHVRRNFLITRNIRDYLVLLRWFRERRR